MNNRVCLPVIKSYFGSLCKEIIVLTASECKRYGYYRKSSDSNSHKNRSNQSISPVIKVLGVITLLAVIAVIAMQIGLRRMQSENIITHITIECGEKIKLRDFMKEDLIYTDEAVSSVDLSQVDTNIPQEFDFDITVMNVTTTAKLTIADTIAPTCEVVPQDLFADEEIPEAIDCVKDIVDIQQPVVAEYLTTPDMTCTNTSIVQVKLEDLSGNISIVEVPFHIIKDDEPPVISGTKNITAWIGDTIKYRDGITVTDSYDPQPVLTIDNSQVNMKVEGQYPVTYVATDEAGNHSIVEIMLTLKIKPDRYIEPETLYGEAQKILDSITEPGMTDMEKALKIVRWCRYNIHYISKTDTSSWTRAAYDGLTKRQGTCYTFAMVNKALFHCAGIENKIVKRYPYKWSRHYWNLIKIDGQWYHCDSTPRHNYHSYVFMLTDKELANFTGGGYNGYRFDHSKYPASATESVQSRINYSNATIK